MYSDLADVGNREALVKLGLRQKYAGRPPNTVSQNFAAGLDPFGFVSSQYGQQAEQANLSEGEHAKRIGANVLGGAVGSGLLLPSAISGLISGATEFTGTPGSLAKRLSE